MEIWEMAIFPIFRPKLGPNFDPKSHIKFLQIKIIFNWSERQKPYWFLLCFCKTEEQKWKLRVQILTQNLLKWIFLKQILIFVKFHLNGRNHLNNKFGTSKLKNWKGNSRNNHFFQPDFPCNEVFADYIDLELPLDCF